MAKKPSAGETERNRAQYERFVETARELGADENEATFRDKLKVIARQKPKDQSRPLSVRPETLRVI